MVRIKDHKLTYYIEFKNPVDIFDVILPKQIKLRQIFEYTENYIKVSIISAFDNKIFTDEFTDKYDIYEKNIRFTHKGLLEYSNDPAKYFSVKRFYRLDKKNIEIPYEEYEYEFDVFLDEFGLLVNQLVLNEQEQKIVDIFLQDPKISSNIKFVGWKDDFEYYDEYY
jgi:hypothetical protein